MSNILLGLNALQIAGIETLDSIAMVRISEGARQKIAKRAMETLGADVLHGLRARLCTGNFRSGIHKK